MAELLAATNNSGGTAAHLAARGGWKNVLTFLVEHLGDAALAARDNDGWLPAHSAARGGHVEVLRFIATHTSASRRPSIDDYMDSHALSDYMGGPALKSVARKFGKTEVLLFVDEISGRDSGASKQSARKHKDEDFLARLAKAEARDSKTTFKDRLWPSVAKSGSGRITTAQGGCLQCLPNDVIGYIMATLHADGDLCSLLAVRSVDHHLARAARFELAAFTYDERAAAVIAGTLPMHLRLMAERHAAHLLVRNELTDDMAVSLLRHANRSVELIRAGLMGSRWKLNEWLQNDDPHDDHAFELRGFQTISAAEARVPGSSQEPVLSWYTEHWPLRPFKRPHLPCVLAGPPRYMTLAGSQRDQNRVRHIPMELCRLVSSPDADHVGSEYIPIGAELVSALILAQADE